MKARRNSSTARKNLRARAERSLGGSPNQMAPMSPEEVQHTVHELQVHQVELEMQNDELRRRQLELERARDRYAELYDFAPTALLTLSAHGEILEANLGTGKLLGLERGRLMRQKFTRFVPAEAQDTFYLLCRRIFSSDTRQNAELVLVNAESKKRSFVQMEAVRDPANPRKQFRASITDLTERREMEQELRKSEENYRRLFDGSRDATMTTEPASGKFLSGNAAVLKMFEAKTEAEFMAYGPGDLSPERQPDGRASAEKAREMIATALREGVNFFEWTHRRIGGEEFFANVLLTRIEQDGEQRILATVRDITGQKRMEESLRRSERNLTDFFDQAPIGLEWLSVSGTILRANQAQLDLLGYAPEEYLGRYFKDFCADPAGGTALLERLAAKETVRNLRMLLRHKDGTLRHILVDAHVSWSSDRFLYSSIFSRDVTDRVKLEREILEVSEREHRRIAQDLHDGLGQLLAGTAYLTSTLRQKLTDKSLPEARPMARIAKLLDEALTQTRSLARGLHPVKPEANGLMAALHELASQIKMLFEVRCRITCPQPVLVENNAVATHLFRIAQEAVTNAVKHGKPSRIEISLNETPDRIRLAVRDNGVQKSSKRWNNKGMGLRIMQYRAGVIGASLAVQREAGGVTVVCTAHKLNGLITPPRGGVIRSKT